MPQTLSLFLVLLGVLLQEPARSEALSRVDFNKPDTKVAWKAETTQGGAIPADWTVTPDTSAPNPRRVLSIHRINDRARNVFNLYWTPDIRFQDGTLAVDVRANTGVIDQGGGLAWRVQDARNYYLARYNPLERNLRTYIVRDGQRRMLASQENIVLPAGRWWRLEVTHHGNRIRVALDGVTHLNVTNDLLPGAGGVGLWAKADAASSFDNLSLLESAKVPGSTR